MSAAQESGGVPSLILPYGRSQGEAAFQEWSDTVATVFDLDTSLANIRDFRFGFSGWHFGSLVLGLSHSDEIHFQRTKQTIGKSSIDHYLVQVYEGEGRGLTTNVEGRRIDVADGDVWILDLARAAEIKKTSFRCTNLAIPRNLLAPLLSDPDGLHGLKLSRESALGGLLSRYLVDLGAQTPRMTIKEAVSAAQSTLQLIAGCVGPSLDARDQARNGIETATLAAIRTFIDAQLANPALGVDFLCKQFGVSRASLYRLFEPLGGVQAHIRRRRLGRCFHEITTPGPVNARISQIAYRWGFTSEATFSRAFRDAYGVAPGEARAAGYNYHARLAENGGNPSASESELSRWICDLMIF